jgi:uncharacterized membrane protein YhaH (DUF805 family)
MVSEKHGRLDRKRYWLAIIGLFLLKYLMVHFLGTWVIWLELCFVFPIVARFHDFGRSTGLAIALWLSFAFLLPFGGFFSKEFAILPGAPAGLYVLPGFLMYFVAGLIPGDDKANEYGAPGQGFNAINPKAPTSEPSNSLAQSRSVSTNVNTPHRHVSFGKRS